MVRFADSAREGGVDLSIVVEITERHAMDSAREGGVDLSSSAHRAFAVRSRLRPRGRGGFKPVEGSGITKGEKTPPARAGWI